MAGFQSPLMLAARGLLASRGVNTGPVEGSSGYQHTRQGTPRRELLASSVRPQGNASVPRGNPSSPTTRPYSVTNAELLRDKSRHILPFLKVDALAFGDMTYNMEVQEDLRSGKTWCHCSCPDFTFRWEVVDTGDGFSSIRQSNGAFPVETNPNGVPSLCKHLVSLLSDPLFDKAERDWQNRSKQ